MELVKFLILLDVVLIFPWSVSGKTDATSSRHNKLWYFDKNNYNYKIVVDPTIGTGFNNTRCEKSDWSGLICPDINSALQQHHQNSTAFILASGDNIIHYLKPNSSSTLFEGISEIAFVSNSSTEAASIECQVGAGLVFWNSNRIALRNVELSFCGMLRNSTSKNFSSPDFTFELFKISLFFYNCTNVSMDHVTVQHSVNAVGVGMYDTDGTVDVSHSKFTNNTVAKGISLPGGGGFVVEFSYCVPGGTTCSGSNIQTTHNSGSSYTFSYCDFSKNVARSFGTIRLLPFNETYEGLGRGGGLGLFFKSNARGNVIRIVNCNFVRNNAQWGAGMYIGFEDTSMSNEISLENAFFNENECFYATDYGTGGGGIKIVSLVSFGSSNNFLASDPCIIGNSVSIEGSFCNNKALSGGAISFTPGYHSLLQHTTRLKIQSSIFYKNIARLGAAVHVELYPLFSYGIASPVQIENCSFNSNTIDYFGPEKSNYDVGIGTVYAYEISLVFRSNITFTDNFGSGVALIGAHADFCDSNSSFVRNKGNVGGGIALLGSSHFLINDNTWMLFERNCAKDGAAIYNHVVSQGVLKSSVVCFVRHDDPFVMRKDWKATFTFINNCKKSIFSTSVYPCTFNNRETSVELSENLLFCNKSQWIFHKSTCIDEIETQGNEFKLLNTSLIKAFPGRDFWLPIKVLDDLNHDITNITGYSSVVDSSSENSSRNGAVDPKFSLTSSNYLKITGKEDTNVSLKLQSTGSRPHLVRLDVSLQKCPPGFHFHAMGGFDGVKEDYLGKCVCRLMYSYRGNLNCSDQEFKAHIPWNYWIGQDPTGQREGQLVMSELPNLYAEQMEFDNVIILTESLDKLDDTVCGKLNRTGSICGKCKDGFAAAVNTYSYVCTPCNNETQLAKNILLFFTFAYVPYIVLFTGIIFFRLKLTSSAVTGFILFAQLTCSNDLFDFSSHIQSSRAGMQKAYKFVYGLFNLNSFANVMHPFCISKTFSTLDVLCLEYTLALLPLLIILIIYAFLRLKEIRCMCCRRRNLSITTLNLSQLRRRYMNKKNDSTTDERPLLHAFVAFLLLSYTKMSFVSMKILTTVNFFDESGKYLNQPRVFLAGYYSFSNKEFILPYGLIAISVMILFVLVPTLFLVGLPQLIDRLLDKQCCSCFRRVWPTLTIHTILDAFQGYHKPNRRFFSGVYLVFRLSIIVSYVTTNDYLQQYFLQQILVTIMSVLIAIFRPYKREIFNFVDIMIFFDLSIINTISAHFYSKSLTLNGMGKEPPLGIYIVQHILLWLPFFYMLCYITFKLLDRTGLYKYVMRRVEECRNYVNVQPTLHTLEGPGTGRNDFEESESDYDEDADSALFKRALDVNRFWSPMRKGNSRVPTTLISVLRGEESGVHEDTA